MILVMMIMMMTLGYDQVVLGLVGLLLFVQVIVGRVDQDLAARLQGLFAHVIGRWWWHGPDLFGARFLFLAAHELSFSLSLLVAPSLELVAFPYLVLVVQIVRLVSRCRDQTLVGVVDDNVRCWLIYFRRVGDNDYLLLLWRI